MPLGTVYEQPRDPIFQQPASRMTPEGMRMWAGQYTQGMPPPNYGAPQINYSKLAGLSPYNAMQSLITSGLSPEQAAQAYQTWKGTGQGPQTSWNPMGPQFGQQSGRLQVGATGGVPASASTGGAPAGPTSSMAGGGGRPTAMSRNPFFLDPGARAGGSTPTTAAPRPALPPAPAPMQFGGGFAGVDPNVMQQAQQTGQGGMTAGARREGEGMPEWQVGQPGQTPQERSFQFLMAQGMPEAQARQRSGWTGSGTLTSSAAGSRQAVGAFNAANQSKLAAARPAYEAAKARENPASSISHSGGALLPRSGSPMAGVQTSGWASPSPAPTPKPGYTAGGQSINTFGATPGKGFTLGPSGYTWRG